MANTYPTPADLAAEQYGLKNVFNHVDAGLSDGGDYYCPEPASPRFSISPDQGQFVRVYRLLPQPRSIDFVSADRLDLFCCSLIGYPYMKGTELWRHRPEPFLAGNDGNTYTYLDTRGSLTGSSSQGTTRYRYHASRILQVVGVGPRGQNPDTQVIAPNEAYGQYDITVLFEQLPYDVMRRADSMYTEEYSRFLIAQDEGNGRALQTRGGVKWDNSDGDGQPAAGNRVDGDFATTEGFPVLVGENMLTWKWVDVPLLAYNWCGGGVNAFGQANWVTKWYGCVNSADFGALSKSPFVYYKSETLLFRTAHRIPKRCITGQQIWDIVFYFQHSPARDGFGYWNRLLNNKGFMQRYRAKSGQPIYTATSRDFKNLFRSPSAWT
jgi:hypothetical protein